MESILSGDGDGFLRRDRAREKFFDVVNSSRDFRG